MTHPADILPSSLAPRGLSRVQSAVYVGISPGLFDTMVDDGRMPKPKKMNTRSVWDRVQLDEFFAAIPDDNQSDLNPWDEVER